ncbi:MAG: glycosyltransferase family 2 protein [Verrucomicrobia bacterium]|nr:glycosyltransferase family 2 protein [Verrucomicrobiota bacterium]
MQAVEFSLIIPAYNEESVLNRLFGELEAGLNSWVHGSWEVIFVDDGSSDRTAEIILNKNAEDDRFKAVLLSRNFGHQPAVSTGLSYAQGRLVGIIDADLQDPIGVLRQMYEACREGRCNVAYGVRQKRQAPVVLDLSYKVFYRFMNRFSDHPWPVDAGDFCVLDRQTVNLLLQLPESSRIMRGLRSWIGLTQLAFPYRRPARAAGESKYDMLRLTRLALDSMVSFSSAPLQFAVFCGLLASLLCGFTTALFILNRFFPSFTLFGYSVGANPGVTTIVILVLLTSAFNFLCLGIMGQYLALVVREVKRRPQSIVREIVGDLQRNRVAFPTTRHESFFR